MTTKLKQKTLHQRPIKLESFKKLWKTKKALEDEENKELWQEILREYWTKCHKPQGSVTWKDLADRVFSEYVRIRESLQTNNDGICKCVTCGAEMPYTEIQNGHFITRGNMKYRFDIQNCHSQCYKCNCILNGNYQYYTMYMIDVYGRDKVDEMLNDKSLKEYKQYEYEEMIIGWYKEIVDMKRKIKRK